VTTVRVIVEADGGSRGNPGPAGYGVVVRDPLTGSVLVEHSVPLSVTTNNVAEYSGLIAGLSAAADLGAREVVVRMDSKLVVEQMTGRWKIKNPGLRPLAAQAAALVRGFDRVDFEWVPRSRNTAADALANQAMDAAAGARTTVGGAGSWTPRTDQPTRIILVRHGQTEYTESGRYSGRGDVPLSPIGLAQAQATARRIRDMAADVAAVVTSPLTRCAATAAEIAAALPGDVPVRSEPDLIECDFGAWEGKTFAEVRADWPDELDRWMGSTSVAPPDGESFAQVAVRAQRAITGLREAYPGRVLIAVSHVSPIKIVLRDALAAGDEFLFRMHLDAAGLSVVDWWPDDGVSVRHINDTAHLSSVTTDR
jgi:ribonuclease H / adenosylcobalamin/alpha-ribazole phosphatase